MKNTHMCLYSPRRARQTEMILGLIVRAQLDIACLCPKDKKGAFTWFRVTALDGLL